MRYRKKIKGNEKDDCIGIRFVSSSNYYQLLYCGCKTKLKYEQYGDDVSFIKKFLKDDLEGKRETAVSELINSGGEFMVTIILRQKAKRMKNL